MNSYALVYRRSKKSSALVAIFFSVLIFTAFLIQIFEFPLIAFALFFISIYVALRIPLVFLAKNVKKVEIEKVAEVEMKFREVFKALLLCSRTYLLSVLSLSLLSIFFLVQSSIYFILILNLLLLFCLLPASANTRIVICKEGIVDGRSILNEWEDFSEVELKGKWIVLKRRFNFPIVLTADKWREFEIKFSPSPRLDTSAFR
ncbi:hypothetical protein Ferp_1235 [Ferroglobus placidus DSM 10642]|uniref:Uncharacterized protein n=1 Tax=Ferroglobus placidus (strain DSM 10642 / AEDII12DO) TaxID=589924 RepID=D3RY26_FERPA|nr:hypothetical protein Ferp_1235 [Ferroglobus placidus DSM 10642]